MMTKHPRSRNERRRRNFLAKELSENKYRQRIKEDKKKSVLLLKLKEQELDEE